MIRVSARSRLRCAYCHADAFGAVTCEGCRTLVHPACSAEVGRCPTLGCVERPAALVVAPKRSSVPGWRFDWLVIAALVAIVLSAAVQKLEAALDDRMRHGAEKIETRITERIR